MFGKLTVAILALSLFACAKPNYADKSATTPGESTKTEPPGSGGAVDAPADGNDGQPPTDDSRDSAQPQARLPVSQMPVFLEWEKKPTDEEFGSFILRTGQSSNDPEDVDGNLAVVLWMPSMGHGSSPVTVERIAKGTYRASKVFFTMPGDWEIRIQRKVGGRVAEQTAIAIRL